MENLPQSSSWRNFIVDLVELNGKANFLKIFDALGRIILTKEISNENDFSISTYSISNGIYFVHIVNEEGKVGVKKLIVQK